MKPNIFFVLITSSGILFSCSGDIHSPNKISSKQKVEKRLTKDSKYQILVWDDYKIQESNGPDFTVYHIFPADTTDKKFGNAGLYFGGHPQRIQPDSDKKLIKDTLIAGTLLNKKISWTLFDYGSSISAETILEMGDYDKISAFAFGRSYSDIDSLIKVLESLEQKE